MELKKLKQSNGLFLTQRQVWRLRLRRDGLRGGPAMSPGGGECRRRRVGGGGGRHVVAYWSSGAGTDPLVVKEATKSRAVLKAVVAELPLSPACVDLATVHLLGLEIRRRPARR
jgi:hypothetical protein